MNLVAPAVEGSVSFGLGGTETLPILFEVELETFLARFLKVPVWAGIIPPGTTTRALPALVYNLISTESDVNLDGPSDLVAWSVQIDAYGDSRYAVALLVARLKSLLHGFSGMMGAAEVPNCLRDDDSHGFTPKADASGLAKHRKTSMYTIWFRESDLSYS